MKKLFLTLVITLIIGVTYGQRAKIENDTAYYGAIKYYEGLEVQLLYGSDNKKDFVFVKMGSSMTGFRPVESKWAKYVVKIDKIMKQQGKVIARGVVQDAGSLNAIGGNKVFIDIEGAIDNKEIKEPN